MSLTYLDDFQAPENADRFFVDSDNETLITFEDDKEVTGSLDVDEALTATFD